MSDDVPDGAESDIRRRAAWLLVMLALVAALFVTLMVTFFNSSGSDNGGGVADLAGPTDGPAAPTSTGNTASRGAASSDAAPSGGAATGSTGSSGSATSSTPAGDRKASCPDKKTCALPDDIGNAVTAINDYRVKNGKAAVPGSVSEQAKLCALNNGTGCKGGWAETQVPGPDGAAAVAKILKFGKLLSDMKSIEVGWAYNPEGKQYYFAIIRQG